LTGKLTHPCGVVEHQDVRPRGLPAAWADRKAAAGFQCIQVNRQIVAGFWCCIPGLLLVRAGLLLLALQTMDAPVLLCDGLCREARLEELAIDIRGDDEAASPSGGGACAPGAQDGMTCVRLGLAIALEAMPVERPCHARPGGEPQGLRHALEGDALAASAWRSFLVDWCFLGFGRISAVDNLRE
jgi:hypothetical protein